MWTKLKNKFFNKGNNVSIEALLLQIKALREMSDVIVLYGAPTEGNWLGIANATKGLYPEQAVEIPQWYSNLKLSSLQEKEILHLIASLKFDKVIFSGFASYFFNWINYLYTSTKIEILFHGTISEFHDENRRNFIAELIRFGQHKKINRFGFVKTGLAEVFNKLYQFNCYHQALNTPLIPNNLIKINLNPDKIHIGVFGGDTFNKNLHNQVIHALMIENTIVHVLDKSIFAYLMQEDRIVEHGKNLSREKFLSIIAAMDLNLYLSYSESWGLVAYESEALGVPSIKAIDVDYLSIIREKLAQNHSKTL